MTRADDTVAVGSDLGSRSSGGFPIPNNFDLLRLVAALQVVYFHAQFHLKNSLGALTGPLRWILGPLMGVPIFFIISGFLVSSSYERHRNYRAYARNRVVRIYPALWVCLAFTVGILGIGGYLGREGLTPHLGAWVAGQLTIGQSFHLPAFRAYATGIPNGSLWTISVEVLFYLGLPFLYLLCIDRRARRPATLILTALGALSFILAIAMVWMDPNNLAGVTKLLAQTPLPYLYLFLIGIICQRNFDVIAPWVIGRAVYWAIGYYMVASAIRTQTCNVALGWCPTQSNAPDAGVFLLSQLLLAGLVFSVAFSARNLSSRLLRGNDVSYGTYLFHMLLINIVVDARIRSHLWLTPAIVVGSVMLGWLSWMFVERPALRRWKSRDGTNQALGTPTRR